MVFIKTIWDHLQSGKKRLTVFAGILLIAVLLFNGFYHLGSGAIRSWDESLYGITACEMLDNGNYIMHTLDYTVDYWNLKPVLAFYGNLAGFMIFGKNLFGLRFFSVMAYLLIAGMMFLFVRREAGLPAAFVSCFAFAAAPANWVHCFVTGDPDSWFILLIFASFICLWTSVKRGWLLPTAAFFMALAFLTRSFHAGPYGLFSLIWVAVYRKKYRWYHLLSSVPAMVLPVGIWAVARYHADGWNFFRAMIELDLLGRVNNGTPDHGASPWYTYLARLNHFLLFIPLFFSAGAVFAGQYLKGNAWLTGQKRQLYLWSLGYFLWIIFLYSCCTVKLEWYIWPCLPFLAVITGLHFQLALDWMRESLTPGFRGKKYQTVISLLTLLSFLVWLGIGEGKAVRFHVKRKKQQDILLWQTGSREYAGLHFYSVDFSGKYIPVPKDLLLVLRFLSCRVDQGDIDRFSASGSHQYLLGTFDEALSPADLQRLAEAFAAKHSLSLIRGQNKTALFRKKTVPPR